MNASWGMFSQILKLIPRTDFESIVKTTAAQKGAKGFSSSGRLVAMLFCQLGRAHSLREIEGGLKSCEGTRSHLGIEAPARSSLAYANAHRPWQTFEKVFYGLYETVAARALGKHKFRFNNKLVSIDSTVIDRCLSMYDWARHRQTKRAAKLHLVLDHDGYLPCFGIITDGKVHEVKVAHQIHFAPGTIVVDDRGYNDYRLFASWPPRRRSRRHRSRARRLKVETACRSGCRRGRGRLSLGDYQRVRAVAMIKGFAVGIILPAHG